MGCVISKTDTISEPIPYYLRTPRDMSAKEAAKYRALMNTAMTQNEINIKT